MSAEPGLFEVMYTCRAMRRLKPDPVPEDLLLKLCESGNQGPTGSNMQQLRWIIVRDQEVKQRLAELNKKGVAGYSGPAAAASGASSAPEPSPKRQRMMDAVRWQADHFHEISAFIIPCAPMGRSGHRGAAGSSVWPGVQNVLLAARGLGLGAALTTLGLADLEAAQKALGLPAEIEPYAILPVGYPSGNFGPVTRLPVAETVRWDRWE